MNGIVIRASDTLSAGATLRLVIPPVAESEMRAEAIPLSIVYEDDDLLVVDKPAGLVVHPAPGHATGTLVNALLHHAEALPGIAGVARPGLVHRLDKDTSGLLIVAKDDLAQSSLMAQLKARRVKKTYLALVRGYFFTDTIVNWQIVIPSFGTVTGPFQITQNYGLTVDAPTITVSPCSLTAVATGTTVNQTITRGMVLSLDGQRRRHRRRGSHLSHQVRLEGPPDPPPGGAARLGDRPAGLSARAGDGTRLAALRCDRSFPHGAADQQDQPVQRHDAPVDSCGNERLDAEHESRLHCGSGTGSLRRIWPHRRSLPPSARQHGVRLARPQGPALPVSWLAVRQEGNLP